MYNQYVYLWQITTCNSHLVLISQQKQNVNWFSRPNNRKLLCHIIKSYEGPCSRSQWHTQDEERCKQRRPQLLPESFPSWLKLKMRVFQRNSLELRPVRVLRSANLDCLNESVYVCAARLKKLSTNEKPPGSTPRAASIKILMSYSA